jgi:MFS family permease
LGLTFIWSIAFSMTNATRESIVPQLVARQDLVNAVALNNAVRSGGRIIGPLMAGIIIACWNIAACFLVNALLMVPLAFALLAARVAGPAHSARHDNILKAFAEGFRYIGRNRPVALLLLFTTLPTFFGMAYTVLVPVIARDLLGVGASGYGTLLSASAAGGLLASLTTANLGRFRRKGLLMLCVAITFGLLLVALALSRWYLLSVALALLGGATNISYLILANSLIQLQVSDQMRGRVMSIFILNPAVLHHLGTLFLGALAAAIGTAPALAATGITVSITVTIMTIRAGQLRHL